MDKNLPKNRFGFIAYRTFYELSYQSKKSKTYEDFMYSQYYLAFIKFGKYLIEINAMYPEHFISTLIKSGAKLDKWTNPSLYESYLRDLTTREPAEQGVERTILLMKQWSDETGNEYYDFFRKIQPTLAVNYIQQGRISPWALYNCDSGQELLDMLNEDQIVLISDWLDPDKWKRKFALNKDDRVFCKELLKSANL